VGSGALGVAVAVVAAVLAWAVDRRRRAYTDQATTPAAAVFAGRNEVKGRAWAATPVVSHLTATPAVWWCYVLEEERRHTRTVTTRDSKGHSHTRTETYHQWHEIDRKEAALPSFEVVDDTGSVPVRLGAAKVIPRQLHRDVVRRDDGGGFLEKMFDNRTGRYQETETAVAIGDPLFVVGDAVLDEATSVPVLSREVMVSTRSEESHTGMLGLGVGALALVAAGAAAVGSALLLSPDDPRRPTAWLPGLVISGLVFLVAWLVTIYNRLHLLAEAVDRAWTLVDVQLQRRHDLVPALARTVSAHAAHERALTELAAGGRWKAGRARRTAELAGEAATQTGHLRQILGVAEAYPQLTSDASFGRLQAELADCENRIAGSRSFYNDSLLLLRNRSQSFPGLLVARRLKVARHDLIPPEGFERTVPVVEHSFT
jgi:hypothetical protein